MAFLGFGFQVFTKFGPVGASWPHGLASGATGPVLAAARRRQYFLSNLAGGFWQTPPQLAEGHLGRDGPPPRLAEAVERAALAPGHAQNAAARAPGGEALGVFGDAAAAAPSLRPAESRGGRGCGGRGGRRGSQREPRSGVGG